MDVFMQSFGDFGNSSESDASPLSSPRSPIPNSEVNILASENPKKRAGRKIFHETRHPVYRGVRRRNKDKWVSEMRIPNDNKSRIWLGTYTTPEMAARAHDVASLTLRGKSACLNFADSAWRVTLPESTDAVVIRKAAMEAAIMFSGDCHRPPPQQQIVTVEEELSPVVSDLRMIFSDEPIMSPSPSKTDLSYWLNISSIQGLAAVDIAAVYIGSLIAQVRSVPPGDPCKV